MNRMGKKTAVEAGNPYFQTRAFQKNRNRIIAAIALLPYREAPSGWIKRSSIAVGGLEYVGFSDDYRYLLMVSSSGRGVYHVPSGDNETVTHRVEWLSETEVLITDHMGGAWVVAAS